MPRLALILLLALSFAVPSAAADQLAGYVTARSESSTRTVSGPVRYGRHGLQVQLPGGTWIDCVKSCSETLRLNTVDFWESEASGNRNATTFGPGLFGTKLRWEWSW